MTKKQTLLTISHQLLEAIQNHRHDLQVKHLTVLIKELESL